MRLNKQRGSSESGFNMTPMIDIVFLLIIFFMTVSQITRVADHPVDLPVVATGGQATDPISMTINVDRTGQLIVAQKKIDFAELLTMIRQQLAKANQDTDRLRIRIRADRRCEMATINRLVKEFESLSITRVRYAIKGVH